VVKAHGQESQNGRRMWAEVDHVVPVERRQIFIVGYLQYLESKHCVQLGTEL